VKIEEQLVSPKNDNMNIANIRIRVFIVVVFVRGLQVTHLYQ